MRAIFRLTTRLSTASTRRNLHSLQQQQHTTTATPPHPPPPSPPPNTKTHHNKIATAIATATILATLPLANAETEGTPNAPPTPPPTSGMLDWPSVIQALREAKQMNPRTGGFRASRQAHVRKEHTTSYENHTSYTHVVEFTLTCDADVHTVVSTLAAGLAGTSDAILQIEESGTLRRTIIREDGAFEITVCVPRVCPYDRRVCVEVFKQNGALFSDSEVQALVAAYRSSQTPASTHDDVRFLDGKNAVDIGPRTYMERGRLRGSQNANPFAFAEEDILDDGEDEESEKQEARRKLEELGVQIFESETLSWDALAGYTEVKERIEETLTLPLRHPEVYERIARGTRERMECNVPKAVLYEGPPGCGKTLSARILASTIGVPFVHVRVETLLSKFYGETTKKLADILEAANSLGRCIVFLDECDSVGLRRSGGGQDVHEVTRRTLSVLLRFIDGMEGARNAIVLAATNHKEDLDAALMSRFDVVVSFPLPDLSTRVSVLKLYAKQLNEGDLNVLADMTWGFSGRELVDVCEEAERMRAGVIVREGVLLADGDDGELRRSELGRGEMDILPGVEEYVKAVARKADHVVGRWSEQFVAQGGLASRFE